MHSSLAGADFNLTEVSMSDLVVIVYPTEQKPKKCVNV